MPITFKLYKTINTEFFMTRDLPLIHLSKTDKEVNLALKTLSHETATTPNEREKEDEVSFSTKTQKTSLKRGWKDPKNQRLGRTASK